MSTKEDLRALHNLGKEAQSKYVYYLLAVAAAAIAFSVHQTKDSALGCSQIPLGIAVICWGASFFYGCKSAKYGIEYLSINWQWLCLFDPNYNDMSKTEENKKLGKVKLNEKENQYNKTIAYQFKLLMAGAIMFILWHVLEMFLRVQYI